MPELTAEARKELEKKLDGDWNKIWEEHKRREREEHENNRRIEKRKSLPNGKTQ